MPRVAAPLSAARVAKLTKPGRHADGNGLYLQVGPTGGKSWLFRYMLDGRAREMGLDPFPAISLAEARQRALEAAKLKSGGIDPLGERERQRAANRLDRARSMTFEQAAQQCIASKRAGWKNAKHAVQWGATLETYAFPIFGSLPVAEIDTALVMKALEPIWTLKPETASRLRGRIEAVLDWSGVRRYRTGDNPARWRGHLQYLLPARAMVRAVKHHPALRHAEMPAFWAALASQEGVAADALRFAILTAARSGEVRGAHWGEFDFEERTWTVPASRMKAKREHRVPLSDAAMAILLRMREVATSELVFPGNRRGRPLSDMALLQVLRRMGRSDITAHGFRSTFRDWAAERTAFAREVAEAALAHTLSDKVEAAYRRGDLFTKRRRLMEAWAGFAGSPSNGGAVAKSRN